MSSLDGTVPIKIGGKDYKLRFDWRALAELRDFFGQNYDEKIVRACMESDTDSMAAIMAAGIEELEADHVKASSPPVLESIQAVNKALNFAFYGAYQPPEESGEKKFLARLKNLILFWKR